MIEGDVEMLEAVPFSVVLGADLARLLRVQVGDNVDMLLPRLTVSPMGVFPRIRSVRVAGIFAVGAPPDARVVYTSESTARKLLDQPESAACSFAWLTVISRHWFGRISRQ